MTVVPLSEDLHQFRFEPPDGKVTGVNIFALYGDDEWMVFDTGYESYMQELPKELGDGNIRHVTLTHFHPDHISGLLTMERQSVIGSRYYHQTLKSFGIADHPLLVPDICVKDTLKIEFHGHAITMYVNPSHALCSLLIDIDTEFLLIGDDYITTNDNEPVLPYIAHTVDAHINGLIRTIRDFQGYTFIPSHGCATSDPEDLKSRLDYLRFCRSGESDMNILYESTDIRYLNEHWHKSNLSK